MISEKNFDISLNPTNLFTSDVPVKGKAYCRLFIDVVGEGSWEIISDSTYDIINDVIVFPVQPSGKYLSLQVSTTPAELTQSPTENSMILTIKNEIKKVADNMENVISLNDTLDVIVPNITMVGVVADNILNVNKVAPDITKVEVVANDITKVGVVADNILNVNAVGDNIPKVINVDTNMTKISNVDANMTKIGNVDANMTKIGNVDANMTDINNAEENAQLALYYKNLAEKWASELEDVVVADGKFSAYHWALKAYQLVTEGIINDITSSTTTTYSSDKLDDLLALKANLLNPIFSKSASIGGATLSSWGNTYSVVEGISGSFYGNDGLNTIIGNNAYFDGTNWRYKANGKATLQILSADNLVFNTTLSGSADGIITWNIVATLSNDNVLIPYIQNQIDNINTKLSNHVALSGVTAYHLLSGNLSLDNTANVQISNGIIPLAHGVDSNGSKNSIVVANETITGLTYTKGKNYLYRHDTGYGVKAYEPRYLASELVRRFAGEQPDYYDVESNKWFNCDAGTELVTNGTFSSGVTTGWTAQDGAVLSVNNGTLKVLNGTENAGSAYQLISGLTIGKKYKIKVKDVGGNTNYSAIYLAYNEPTRAYVSYLTGGSSGGALSTFTVDTEFIAQATSVYIVLRNEINAINLYNNFDDISIFPIDIVPTTEITESRNYMNHVIHADASGNVLYVEELPKIEYKNVIKADEYLGKNACTALISAKCDSTPAIIENTVNFSAVIRASTGVHDFYFDEPMDNLNYGVFCNFIIAGTPSFQATYYKFLNKVRIETVQGNQVYNNPTSISIATFGGRN